MHTFENKESMQGACGAGKSSNGKSFPCNSQHTRSVGEDLVNLKDVPRAYKIGEPMKPKGSHIEFQKYSKSNKSVYIPSYNSRTVPVAPMNNLPVNSFGGPLYPCVGNYFPGVPVPPFPFGMLSYAYPYEAQFQEFQYFVVIDFEATCDKDRIPHPQEIIEFPSVVVNAMTGHLEAHFQTYVRPTCNQHLTDFCKDLTGIQQTQVDKGVTLDEALIRHDMWLEQLGIKNSKFAVVTWSNWDCQVMLESECRIKKIHKPAYFNQWINLKVPFSQVFGNIRCNLKEAVEKAGLVWQGRAHCGLDDAKNTASLLAHLMQTGLKLSITNSLTGESADDSVSQIQPPAYIYSPPIYFTPPHILSSAAFVKLIPAWGSPESQVQCRIATSSSVINSPAVEALGQQFECVAMVP